MPLQVTKWKKQIFSFIKFLLNRPFHDTVFEIKKLMLGGQIKFFHGSMIGH